MNFSHTHTRFAELEIFQHPISFTACDRHGTVHRRRCCVSSLMYDVQKKKLKTLKANAFAARGAIDIKELA